jgi:hypothetical protein
MADVNKWTKLDQLRGGLEEEIKVELNKANREISLQVKPLQDQIDRIRATSLQAVREQAVQKLQILEADLTDLGFEEIGITHSLDEHGLKIKVRAAG